MIGGTQNIILRCMGWLGPCLAAAVALADPAPANLWNVAVSNHTPTRVLLARDTIRIEADGVVPVAYASAIGLLTRSNLLEQIQEAYAQSLPPGQSPEFALDPVGANTWRYSNGRNEESEVHEVARGVTGSNTLVAAYYATGNRFFGQFESLTLIRVWADSNNQAAYHVQVFAYPHLAICRFLARHLGIVERFFRDKTKEMEGISARICGQLCANNTG